MTLFVQVEKAEKVAIVTINNPPLNVMNTLVVQELNEVFSGFEYDDEVVAVIITGYGNKAFMAGADIKEFPQLIGKANLKPTFMESHAVLNRIDNFPKPTIAVLNGLTLGGGCELALTCDIRIAEEHAQLGLPEIKLGLFPGGGGTQRLPRLVGESKAKELMFTGDAITAQTAEKIGLVNSVVPTGEGLQTAKDLAKKISRHSLQALSRIKRAVDEGADLSLEKSIEREAELFEEVFQTEDIKEGVQAFIEKRRPTFSNR
ncbi:enoyl-CoA hydratase [Cytobacillus sp. S13-E01]|uniref:enoyl-CoA hydratase n=1 Tax=Cytobacillus sp. S13-E01 TaxID=3031326 RepID=UPI0023D8219C|nr:enoyl-CoA hydratase [Cytobacillus sp. S13-E01]MDF0725423.1 enoyl-CoA hydratase [Cytobacillus sp. S13-E01]